MRRITSLAALVAPIALSACVVAPPAGPTVIAMPGQGKSFEAFQQDDAACRGWASQQTGGAAAGRGGDQRAVGSAVLGTALGAAAGAAIGSVGGAVGAGAAIGAATGLLAGSAIGASTPRPRPATSSTATTPPMPSAWPAKGDSVQMPQPGYAGGYPYGAAYPAYGYARLSVWLPVRLRPMPARPS